MWNDIANWFKSLAGNFSKLDTKQVYSPIYHVVEINKTETDDYIATIQLINKNVIFQIKPEEILSNDKLVNQFSPCDIRTLTYLGYLSLNNPSYKILAQRLSETNDKVLFALKKRGDQNIIIKSADEIFKEKDILNNLGSEDSQVIGYTAANESMMKERQEKDILKNHKKPAH